MDWFQKYFTENWVKIDSDIDFSKYEPIKTSNSLHIYEERYEINGEIYRLLYVIGGNDKPNVEILK